jgi:hypothetical protein
LARHGSTGWLKAICARITTDRLCLPGSANIACERFFQAWGALRCTMHTVTDALQELQQKIA